jgi:spore coat protein CotH
MMREKLYLDFCFDAGIPAPRGTYANLYLNDTLWGLYSLVEQVNKTFLEDRFFNDGGNLFKGDPKGTLEWAGAADSLYYDKYELKTNKTANDWSDLVHLLDKIKNTPNLTFYDSLETVLNTTAWIKSWAANSIFVNLDSYMGTGHNYYIYHNTASGLFDPVLWDCNEAFGKFSFGMNVMQLESLSLFWMPPPPNNRPLQAKMLQNNIYRNDYISAICQLTQSYFNHSYFDPKIDSLASVIRPSVYADSLKPFSNLNFENNLMTNMGNTPGLKSFITNRRNSLISQLTANGCLVDIEENAASGNGIYIFPNPVIDDLNIKSADGGTDGLAMHISSVTIYDITGRPITNTEYPDTYSGNTVINVANLKSGLYLVRLSTEDKTVTRKFIKR